MRITRPEPLAPTRWGRYLTEQERRAVLDGAAQAGGRRHALDVGCGTGRWSLLLHELGWSVTCTDVDPKTLRRCEERVPDARCVLVDPSTTLPADDVSVGLLTLIEVRAVAEAPWFPAEAARVLAPSGVLVMTMQNPHSLRGLVHGLRRRAGRPGQDLYRGPPYRALTRSLTASQFEITRGVGLGWVPASFRTNNRIVSLGFRVEAAVGLRHLPAISPIVIITAKKQPAG